MTAPISHIPKLKKRFRYSNSNQDDIRVSQEILLKNKSIHTGFINSLRGFSKRSDVKIYQIVVQYIH